MIQRTLIAVPADDAGEWRQIVLDGNHLDALLLAEAITDEQHEAGVRWFADWYHSGLAGRGASWRDGGGRWVPASPFERMDEPETASWKRYSDALMVLPLGWPRLVTSAVVLFDGPCKNLVALRVGLDALVHFYDTKRI